MRILISGGVKTKNIVDAVRPKFISSGDEFIVVYYLEDIQNIFASGDFFDKAIIIENSITRDGTIKDEQDIRNRIYDFVQDMNNRLNMRKMSFVFLSQTEKMCEIVHDEILTIMEYSAVVIKKPPYFVPFFTDLIVTDVKQYTDEITYKPKRISFVENDTNAEDKDSVFEDMEFNGSEVEYAGDNFGSTLFNSDYAPNSGIEGLNIKGEGEDELPEVDEYEEDNYSEEDEYNDKYEYDDEYEGEYKDGYSDGVEIDELYEDGDSYTYGPEEERDQSGQIPNYEETTIYDGNGHLQGFDDEVSEDQYYSDETEDNFYDTEDNNEEQEYENDSEMYAMDDTENDLYSVSDNEYQEGFTESLYNAGDEYGQNNDMDISIYANESENQSAYNEGGATNKKRRGLIGRKNNKNTDVPQVETEIKETGSINLKELQKALRPFAARGNSIVVTGCGGCGTSTIAYNLANLAAQIGYTALLVDMDVNGKTQSYISKNSYEAMDIEGANLMAAVNSSMNIQSNVATVKERFHLLTMGLATDNSKIEDIIHKEKIARFTSVAKTAYNFIIYDIPFNYATNYLSDITFSCENLVLVIDTSNWGITKTMVSVCNIESEDMQDIVFSKAQIVFNKYRNLNRLFGQKVRTADEITKMMDRRVIELIGDDIGLKFSSMGIAGLIKDDPIFENGWYEEVQYSDTKKGFITYADILENIVLKKNG